jgi:hypothetical protein
VLEAEVLARYLREQIPAGRILQVYREETGAAPARALRRALADWEGAHVEDRRIEPGVELTASFWSDLARQTPPAAALVLWLRDEDLGELRAIEGPAAPGGIYLSSTLCRSPREVAPESLRGSSRLIHRFALAAAREQNLKQVRPWMHAREIPLTDPRLQLSAYYAARLAGEALMHIRSNFSRDYFIEKIEHAVDRLSGPSAYPRLSLGPDQRFLSKGGYIAKLSDQEESGISPLEWLVP